MTKSDALAIDRMRDDLAPINDHGIAATPRAAKARLRHDSKRACHAVIRPTPSAETVDATFARIFGEG